MGCSRGKACLPFTNICEEKPKKCFNTSKLKTGLEPEEVRKILARWEGGNAKLSTRASFEALKARVREGKPVIVLKRVGSISIIGTWPAMHWVTVHGFNESAQRIYYTDTENNSRVEAQSYSDFLSQWDWRIGDGLANETIWGKGIRPKTMVWVDRTVAAQTSPSSESLPLSQLPSGSDLGYANLPRAFVDVNGDGLADYCRFVGNHPNDFVACMLRTSDGGWGGQYDYRSITGIDEGYGDRPRGFKDINGDGKADYCRYVGNPPNIIESCNFAESNGFSTDQYHNLE